MAAQRTRTFVEFAPRDLTCVGCGCEQLEPNPPADPDRHAFAKAEKCWESLAPHAETGGVSCWQGCGPNLPSDHIHMALPASMYVAA